MGLSGTQYFCAEVNIFSIGKTVQFLRFDLLNYFATSICKCVIQVLTIAGRY